MSSYIFPILQYCHVDSIESESVFPVVTFLDSRIRDRLDTSVTKTNFRPEDSDVMHREDVTVAHSTPDDFKTKTKGWLLQDYLPYSISFETLLKELAQISIWINERSFKRMGVNYVFLVFDKNQIPCLVNCEYVCGSWSIWLFDDIKKHVEALIKEHGGYFDYDGRCPIRHLPLFMT